MRKKSTLKFTFNDWFNGDVTLEYATIFFKKGNRPTVAEWSNFQTKDKSKIETNQKRIFNENVSSLLEKHKTQFLSRFSNSKMKNTYLKKEIIECKKIMFEKIPTIELIEFEHWGILIDYQYLSDVQYYIKRTITNGIIDGYDFIHSPNNKFQDNSRADYRIYGMFLWEYMNWLINQNQNTSPPKSSPKYITQHWFKVALAFADGRIDDLYNKYPNSSEVARRLGDIKFRPYISDSTANTQPSGQNIFANPKNIERITEYCYKNNISIVNSFHKRVLNAPSKNKRKTNLE